MPPHIADAPETTERGFRIYATFTDSHGHHVRVQESSSGDASSVWIFTTDDSARNVNHWKPGGGWESAPRPGESDPPWKPGDPLRPMSEGWSSMSPHLSPDDCRLVIAALQEHLRAIGEPSDE
jgi:hypothetical protein